MDIALTALKFIPLIYPQGVEKDNGEGPLEHIDGFP